MFSVPQWLPTGLVVAGLLYATILGSGVSWSQTSVSVVPVSVSPGWMEVSPSHSPPPMAGEMMAYSPKANRFVLFGGWDGVAGLNGTWVYDPGNRTWTELHPNISPLGRGDEMFVYDERADVFILFGGWHELANETYIRLADTWTFSLDSATWTERHPVVSPPPRSDSEVAYDPVANAVLLLGGFNGTAYLGDIWSYSLSNDSWSARPAAVEPSPRADGRMVYVQSQDRFILFGGNDYSGPNPPNHHLADTWTYSWSSNTWTLLNTIGGPSARDYPVFSYDPVTDLVFLAGGFGDTILDDLWAFDTKTDAWVNLTPARSPPPRFAAAGGFDTADHLLVVFSGLASTGLLADTWHYSHGPPSAAPDPMLLIVVIGVASASVAGIAIAIVIGLSRGRRSRRLTYSLMQPFAATTNCGADISSPPQALGLVRWNTADANRYRAP